MSQHSLPRLDQFRRIVVKVGSSLLVDRQKGEVKRAGSMRWPRTRRPASATAPTCWSSLRVRWRWPRRAQIAAGRFEARGQPGRRRRRPDRACAHLGRKLGARGIRPGKFSSHSATRRSAAAISTRARRSDACSKCARRRSSTRTTQSPPRKSAMATMIGSPRASPRWPRADLLILCRSQGLYTAPPAENPDAKTDLRGRRASPPRSRRWPGGAASELSRGGMRTKIEAAKIAVTGGAHMVIADGRLEHPMGRIGEGEPCTWFLIGSSNPITARKKWIAGSLEPRARCISMTAPRARSSAARVCCRPASRRAEGNFARGDCVIIRDARRRRDRPRPRRLRRCSRGANHGLELTGRSRRCWAFPAARK